MDPDAAFELIAAALADGDTAGADAACADLKAWLDRGGFTPAAFGSREASAIAAINYYDAFHTGADAAPINQGAN